MTTRLVSELWPHAENARIYGDHADAELVESVRARGVLSPLLVTAANVIISGHRRWLAARRAGLTEVPVIVFGSTDPLDITEALVESNRQRVKTNEQRAREYETLKVIYQQRSRQGQRTDLDDQGCGLFGEDATSESTDSEVRKPSIQAAEAIGGSPATLNRAAAVVKVIDNLEAAGNAEGAEELRQTLNSTVNGAYKQAKAAGAIESKPERRPLPVAETLYDGPARPKAKQADHVTLDAWKAMTKTERGQVIGGAVPSGRFNDQKDNENIEWALWSWNPVTGCLHNCPYCYARDIANRFYEQKFEPSLIPSRLGQPQTTPFPAAKAAEWVGHKNVFTCSMADLFGRWVPREWIDAVLDAVRQAPQWNFLFLTKFPVRMAEFDFPDNAWVGTSVDCQARVANAERSFRKVRAGVKWLSCEPLIEPLEFSDLGAFDWIVLGGASASTQTPEWKPPRAWVQEIEAKADACGVRVYEKTNLGTSEHWRRREYPGITLAPAPEAPEQLRYLATPEKTK